MNRFLCIAAIILYMQPFYAQDSKFDSVFNAVSLETIRMEWAVNVSDSLYKVSKTDEQKARASMLSANLLHQMGKRNEALNHAKRADSIAGRAALYDLQARVCGLTSTIYRVAGLPVEGKIYLEKALEASRKINNPQQSLKFQGNLHQEMAYYEMDSKKHQAAINILIKGKTFFEKIENPGQRNFLLATNEELMAKNYVLLGKFDEALSTYKNGIKNLKASSEESALEGFIYNGMGNVSMEKKDYENALNYYNKALRIAETSQFVALKEEVYPALMNYYKITKDQEKYIEFNEKYLALRNDFEQSNKVSANKAMEELRSKEQSALNWLYIIGGLSLVLTFIGFGSYFYIRKKRKSEKIQFKQVINELKLKSEKQQVKEEKTSYENVQKEFLPAETEQKILGKLEDFENSKKYLEKGFTLAMLAVELETNTKYLSHIVKKHKNSDFSTYINKLRINYIINKLHDEPIYASYKISYLADESGFSSHSKFTTTFKQITGFSPTAFLSLLAKDRDHSR